MAKNIHIDREGNENFVTITDDENKMMSATDILLYFVLAGIGIIALLFF